uniref:Endonuclease/exonuclease/phosphatase domain-containing protein n=1 Tax=Panagrolaimus sp. ES5 TaxID=591445 RepID=A0AC34FG56_9BILA
MSSATTTNSQDPAEKAIQDFARITGVNEALAHFFLQDFDFQLERGLNAYYRQMEKEEDKTETSADDDDDDENDDDDGNDSDVMIIEDDDPMEVDDTETKVTTSQESNPATSTKQPNTKDDKFPDDITLVTYNVDGLDTGNLRTRFQGVVHIIAKINPEIILLQEVVDEHMEVINEVIAPMYHVITPLNKGMPYYTVTLVSKNILSRTMECKPFTNTSMGRTMTVFEGYWQKLRLVVIHSHLESMREHAQARKAQFSECMKKMESNLDAETLVIFAGDLNIRDSELPMIHPQIKDAWIAAGRDKATQYTWDNMKNSNKGLPNNVRYRFDRVYFNGPYKKIDFTLAGTQQIRKVMCYPSDHFAVVCKFWDPVN